MPLLSQREHDGRSFVQRTFDLAQAWQQSRTLRPPLGRAAAGREPPVVVGEAAVMVVVDISQSQHCLSALWKRR